MYTYMHVIITKICHEFVIIKERYMEAFGSKKGEEKMI